ncbi:MAG: LysR substrate-binding domain-containing protein [Pseudomonadota bacterium]
MLRAFVAVVEMGSVARAADWVARSQPAVSLQLKRLEEQIGQALFRKSGRQLELTEGGVLLLRYAQRLLEMNDETVAAVSGLGLSGSIRLGIPQDFAEGFLTTVLARFARAHRQVVVEVRADRNAVLLTQLSRKQVDIALTFGDAEGENVSVLGTVPVVWIGGDNAVALDSGPVPLVVFESPCVFRQAAVEALDQAGKPWRVAFSSPSLASQWAAVEAGLGVGVRTPIGLKGPLRPLKRKDGFPPMRPINVCLHLQSAQPSAPVSVLRSILVDNIREAIGASR